MVRMKNKEREEADMGVADSFRSTHDDRSNIKATYKKTSKICSISLQVKNDYLIHVIYMADVFVLNVFINQCCCSLHEYNIHIKEN